MDFYKEENRLSYQLMLDNSILFDSAEYKIWSPDPDADIFLELIEKDKTKIKQASITFQSSIKQTTLLFILDNEGYIIESKGACDKDLQGKFSKSDMQVIGMGREGYSCFALDADSNEKDLKAPMIFESMGGAIAISSDSVFGTNLTAEESRLTFTHGFCSPGGNGIKIVLKVARNLKQLVAADWSTWEETNTIVDGISQIEHFLCWPVFYKNYQATIKLYPQELTALSGAGKLSLYPILPSVVARMDVDPGMIMQKPPLQFIQDLPIQWENMRLLDIQMGEYIVIARKELSGKDWFVGGLNLGEEREMEVSLNFLENDQHYMAATYSDDQYTQLNKSPDLIAMDRRIVTNRDILKLRCIQNGGFALSIFAVQKAPQ